MEDHPTVTPILTGIQSTHCDDGGQYDNRHWGLDYESLDGHEQEMRLPQTVYEICRRNEIDTVFWTSFPEPAGFEKAPTHTKARNFFRSILGDQPLPQAFQQPLPSSLNFTPPDWVLTRVEAKLKNFGGLADRKLCLIGRNGYTSVGKNWGHLWREDLPEGKRKEGEECRDFMRLMLKKDPNWVFLVMEDRLFEGDDTVRSTVLQCVSYAELFGTPDTATLPFGLVMKSLLHIAELCIGVPAGPHHLAMAHPDIPVVGLWTEHIPAWFDEPKTNAIHLLSQNIKNRELDRRPGSFPETLAHNIIWLDSNIIPGERVLEVCEELI